MLFVSIAAIAAPNVEVNEKVLRAFNETFTNATDVTWNEDANTFQANFKQRSIMVRAKFDKEGNLLSTIRYYYEDNLPAHILSRLKKKHSTKEIFGVTEISTDSEINYYIKVHDEKHWYTIKADNGGNLEQVEKFKKS